MPEADVVTIGAPMLPDPARLAALMGEAIGTGWLANGGVLHSRLERALARDNCRPGQSLALVSSGTTALMLALRLGNLPEGSEVITSPLSFAATVQAIAWCGFRPVFADVDPDTLTLCPRAVEAAVTPRTAAVLPVHFLGVPCDVAGLAQVARRHRLWLVHDAAHAFGVTLDGRPIAAFGDASAFSLHATKVLHTGEGGFVVTGEARAAERLRRLRNFGLEAGRMAGPGINGKLSEMQAAMGLALLPDLPAEIAARHALRARYDAALAGLSAIRVPEGRAGASPALTTYALRMDAGLRARLHWTLAEDRVLARDHFPLLCGPGTAWPDAPIVTTAPAPVAPLVGPEVLCLPFYGRVSDRDADRIAAIVRRVADEEERA
ncbi:DegT/DnrJ/EryC1/StrS family aminotransferase [Paracoccus siganidrum]|uniref:DegT/DnrJ/EryC1/StrS family aminotransferase n=1 Tax=Paracoccus siganidrum TaxID=1276757 RepID=A0A418ZV70_9RHOB|nr:DegT/DnrJ/EryC1/StrS family aminotransferase [Paracoccus siganidrum]RJL03309.1 DegT/DnrJ/EryC1/StrS family aminotransferase [Paracoccus siganidrum]RMC30548.1 DegT/DnrJ/EryC1/StrS family aminotransferase [Paracoccus siganidrum]